MIPKPVEVKSIKPYIIWVKFADGTEGQRDVSYLADKPVFKNWQDPFFFNKVHIDPETFAIAWDENIELCPDTLYLNIKGITFDKWKTETELYAAG